LWVSLGDIGCERGNRTNGNIRVENQPVAGTDTFYEKDKTKTAQTVTPQASGKVLVFQGLHGVI
jgi:hypothetical protein